MLSSWSIYLYLSLLFTNWGTCCTSHGYGKDTESCEALTPRFIQLIWAFKLGSCVGPSLSGGVSLLTNLKWVKEKVSWDHSRPMTDDMNCWLGWQFPPRQVRILLQSFSWKHLTFCEGMFIGGLFEHVIHLYRDFCRFGTQSVYTTSRCLKPNLHWFCYATWGLVTSLAAMSTGGWKYFIWKYPQQLLAIIRLFLFL